MTKEFVALKKMWNRLLHNEVDEAEKYFDFVVKALQRNEPMKPIIADEYLEPECPMCLEKLNRYYYESRSKYTGDNYCPDCGQKLEWR